MSSQESIYYLRALVAARDHFSPPEVRAPELALVAHFYVRADDQPTAGAWAHDWCRLQGLAFVEYICLPNPIVRAQIGESEGEHIQAFELAQSEGEAVVVSVVFGKMPK